MKNLRVLVVDDEQPARDELIFLLRKFPGLKVVGEAESGLKAIEKVKELKPDVVFMDIEMRSVNGCEAAQKILNREAPPLIVFATAFNTHAIEAFEMGAVDYILKPFEESRIKNTVERINRLSEQSSDWSRAVEQVRLIINKEKPIIKKIGLEKNGLIVMVNFSEIVLAEANDKTVTVTTSHGKLLFPGNLSELESRLCKPPFLRVHRSFIVNLEQVTGVIPWFKGTYWLTMDNSGEMRVPVSKSMVKTLKDLLNIV
ncbi:MAG: LytR/AlgR family response regulator transcription factor [Bacillota bacterium]